MEQQTTTPETVAAEQQTEQTTGQEQQQQQQTPDQIQETQPQTQPSESSTADDERTQYAERLKSWYLEHGNLEPFLKAGSVDYTKLSAEEVLRTSLKEQHKDLPDEMFERLYRKEVLEKFSQIEGVFEDKDIELGKLLMQKEADRVRARLIDEQKSFLAPVFDAQPKDQEQQKIRADFEQYISNHDYMKSLSDSKRVAVQVGDQQVYMEVDPEVVKSQALDEEKFFSLFSDGKGGVDMHKWAKVVAYANNMEAFESALVNHGKANGTKSVLESDLKNSSFKILGRTVNSGSGGESDSERIAKALEAALQKKGK